MYVFPPFIARNKHSNIQTFLITVILHLGCLATVLADSWKSYVHHEETQIGSDLNWKEKVIEVLEELLGEKVRTPPAPVVEGLGRQLNQERTKPLWTDQHHKDWSPKYYRSHQRNKQNSIANSLGKICQECTIFKKAC